MRTAAALLLLGLTGCGTRLDPTLALREAGKRLRCTVEEVRPGLEVRFPLERSFLRLDARLGVENPSDVRIQVRGIRATIYLDRAGASHRVGDVATSGNGIGLEPRSKGAAALAFQAAYGDLKAAWQPLSETVLNKGKSTWRLEGTLTVDLLGVSLELPFRSTQESGR